MAEEQLDEFWALLVAPVQEEEDGYEFTNPVVLAKQFAKATGQAAYLGNKLEVLTEQLATYTIQRDRKRRELQELRRKILAKNYSKLTKSASSEIQEAFILARARESGLEPELLALEAAIEQLTQDIESREPRLLMLKARLKTMETIMLGYAKQYLDYDKLMARLQPHG